MTEQDLLSFATDIENLDPIESDARAIELVNYVEEMNYDLKDYKYLHFYSQFNGLINENNNLKEEFKNNEITENPVEILTEATGKGSSKRQRITKLILDSIALVDKGGLNVKKYKDLYESMSDVEFNKFMDSFIKDPDQNFYLEILPNKSEPTITDIEKLLKKLNIPKEEYVYYRDDGFKDDPLRTREQCSVGYVNVRRLQQILSKKNTYSLDIDNRDSKTGQVTGADKIARISDSELYGLTVFKADAAIKEFYSARADNMVSKADMYSKISKYGYVYLDELQSDISKNQTLNTINTYLLGAGIKSNLISDDSTKAKDILKKQIVDSELKKMGNIVKEDVNLNEKSVLTEYFVIYPSNQNGSTLNPRVPNNFMTKNGFEDNKTPRVCASNTINGCLKGLSKNLKGSKLFVHKIITDESPYKPVPSQVPDCHITGEVWFKNPVKLKCLGQIFVSGDDGKNGESYTYGPDKKVAKLYGWTYNWVQKFNNDSNSQPVVKSYGDFVKKEDITLNHHIELDVNQRISKALSNFHPSNILVSSDYHLFDELLENDQKGAIDNVRKILNGHNSKMDETKAFIFLGDLCHKDIGQKMYKQIASIVSNLKGAVKIMVRGIDDDNLDIQKYKDMGFDYIVDRFEYNGIVFTHKPIPKDFFGDDVYLNIHGHIHASRKYYNMEAIGHIDAYTKDHNHNYQPMSIPDLIKLYNKGVYRGVTTIIPEMDYYEEELSMFQNKFMYIALTEEEVAKGYIDYELTEECNGKYVNFSLEGLESFIKESGNGDYKYYTKLPVNKTDLKLIDGTITDSAILKLPFARDIEDYKKLNIKGEI